MSQDGVSHLPRCRDGTAARDPVPGEVSFSFPPALFPVQWLKFASSPSLCGSVLLLTAGAATSRQLEPPGAGGLDMRDPENESGTQDPSRAHGTHPLRDGKRVPCGSTACPQGTQGHTGTHRTPLLWGTQAGDRELGPEQLSRGSPMGAPAWAALSIYPASY